MQLDEAREKHQQEHVSQENIIHELRKKVEQLEEQSLQKSELTLKAETMEIELKEKQRALEEAKANESALKDETEQLRRRLERTETQLAEVLEQLNDAKCRQRPQRNLLMKFVITEIPWLFL